MSLEPLDVAARFGATVRWRDAPAVVRTRLPLVIADTLGVAVAGGVAPVVRRMARMLAEQGHGHASAVGWPECLAAAQAAFLNGLAASWLDYDELSFEAGQHPAVHVVPSALALAEQTGASGELFLDAVLGGYEVGGRVGRATTLRRSLMHPHGTHGTIGAAVSAARILRTGATTMREAIRIASSMTTATSRRANLEGATVRHAYTAQAAQNGVLAAQLATAGVIGESKGLHTVFGEVSGTRFEPSELVRGLGREYLVADNLVKAYDCGADAHPAIEAARTALNGRSLGNHEILAVEVRTYANAASLSSAATDNAQMARLSLPYTIARVLRGAPLGIHAFVEQKPRSEPVTHDLMRRIRVQEDPEATALHPGVQRASVAIELVSGETLRATAVFDAKVRLAWPSADDIRGKFMDLVSGPLGPYRARRLLHEIEHLADGGQPRVIGELLRHREDGRSQ